MDSNTGGTVLEESALAIRVPKLLFASFSLFFLICESYMSYVYIFLINGISRNNDNFIEN